MIQVQIHNDTNMINYACTELYRHYGYTYMDTHEDMGKCRNAGGMKPESEIATTLDALAF